MDWRLPRSSVEEWEWEVKSSQCDDVSVVYVRWWSVGSEGWDGKGKWRESGRGGGKFSHLSWTRKEVVGLYLFISTKYQDSKVFNIKILRPTRL